MDAKMRCSHSKVENLITVSDRFTEKYTISNKQRTTPTMANEAVNVGQKEVRKMVVSGSRKETGTLGFVLKRRRSLLRTGPPVEFQ